MMTKIREVLKDRDNYLIEWDDPGVGLDKNFQQRPVNIKQTMTIDDAIDTQRCIGDKREASEDILLADFMITDYARFIKKGE